MTDAHEAVGKDLARRRELVAMTKPELISYVVMIESNLAALADRIERIGL